MRLRGWKSVRQAARWGRSRLAARSLILGYHRVAEEPGDPFSLSVSPKNFSQQLEAIRRYGHPLSLAELVEAISGDSLPDRSVVVTFDDGYADLLTVANPLLEGARMPATVFVISGLLGREFWWDALWRMLRTSDHLPERFRLPIGSGAFECVSPDGGRGIDHRRDLLFKLHAQFLRLTEEQRREALDALSELAGGEAEDLATPRALEPDEVVELARGSLIEVGAHSCTHESLPTLPPDRQRSEIQASKADLERLIGQPVVSFSYPHGGWTRQTADIVRESGYRSACTSRSDVVGPGSDRFELPRFWVPNWDGTRFSRWLGRWLGHPLEEWS